MLKETTSGGGETVNNYYPGGPCGGVPYGYGYGYGYPPCNNGGGWNLGNLLGGGTVNFGRGGFGTGLAGVITGAIALAAVGANGGLRNLFGGWGGAPYGAPYGVPYGANGCCDGGYVTHKELGLVREINEERSKNAALVAQTYTDRATERINARITRVADDQALVNCAVTNDLGLLNRQAREVSRMTTRIIKPSSLATSQAVLTAFNNRLDALAEGRAVDPTPADEDPAAGA